MQKLHKQANMLQWILGRFGFLQNSFEMRLAKNLIEEEPLMFGQTLIEVKI